MTLHEPSGDYWYCQEHHRVERFADRDSDLVIGPFPTEQEAAHALDTIREREKAYDAEGSDDE